ALRSAQGTFPDAGPSLRGAMRVIDFGRQCAGRLEPEPLRPTQNRRQRVRTEPEKPGCQPLPLRRRKAPPQAHLSRTSVLACSARRDPTRPWLWRHCGTLGQAGEQYRRLAASLRKGRGRNQERLVVRQAKLAQLRQLCLGPSCSSRLSFFITSNFRTERLF